MRKLLSCALAMAMTASFAVPSFGMNHIEAAISTEYEVFPELSEEAIEKGIEQALQMYLDNIEDPAERSDMEAGIRGYIEEVPDAAMYGFNLEDLWDALVPDIHIKNKYVAASIDVIISGVLVASGVGTVAAAAKHYGTAQLRKIFTNTIKTRILGKAAIAIGVSVPVIVDFIMSIVDPSTRIAEYIDSKDHKPNNGYLDVIW